MRRFFTERTNLRPGSSVKLPENEASHIRDSLRLQKGEEIILFNGERSFVAYLGLVTKNAVMANIIREDAAAAGGSIAAATHVTIAMSLIKPQNFELVLQKCTELGVTSFRPIVADFSQQDPKTVERKRERWEKIILEACKQSERIDIPILLEPISLAEFLQNETTTKVALILQRQFPEMQNIESSELTAEFIDVNEFRDLEAMEISLIVGPEGGFSPREHELLLHSNTKLLEFAGGRILKAETAAIAATALFQA